MAVNGTTARGTGETKGQKDDTAVPVLEAIRSPRVAKTKLPLSEGTKVPVFGLKTSRVSRIKLPFSAGTKVPLAGVNTPCPNSREFPVVPGMKVRVDRLI